MDLWKTKSLLVLWLLEWLDERDLWAQLQTSEEVKKTLRLDVLDFVLNFVLGRTEDLPHPSRRPPQSQGHATVGHSD